MNTKNTESKVFLSYSRKDKKIVFSIKDKIEELLGKDACWIDINGIESDQQFTDVIINAINSTPIFIFLYSANSKDSVYAKKELEFATKKDKKIVFVNIDGSRLSDWFEFHYGSHDIIDMSKPAEVEKLWRNLLDWCELPDESQAKKKQSDQHGKHSYSRLGAIVKGLIAVIICCIIGSLVYWYKNRDPYKDLTGEQLVDLADSLSTIHETPPMKLITRGESPKIINLYRIGAERCDQESFGERQSFNYTAKYDLIDHAARLANYAGYAWQCIEEYDKSIKSYKDAVQYSQKIVTSFPEHKDGRLLLAYNLNNLSYSYMLNGNVAEAIQSIDDAIELAPSLLEYHDSKGELLYLSGQMEEALKEWDLIHTTDKFYSQSYWVDSCKAHISNK